MVISSDIRAIIWDLDGTIIDSFHIFQAILTRLAQERGLSVPSEEVLADNFHGSLVDSVEGSFGGRLHGKDLDDFMEHFLDIQHEYYLDMDGHLLDDAVDLSARAHTGNLKQFIITNRNHKGRGKASPRFIVSNTVLGEYIHEIICGDEVGEVRKPQAGVLGDLLERWKLQPSEVLVIGDQHVDAQLALNIGCKAVLVIREGKELKHTHKLDKNWQDHVTVVRSLHDVLLGAKDGSQN